MHSFAFVPLVSAALVAAQGGCPPPDPILLSTTKSGVLPVLPATPFPGVETLEGAIIVKGPPNASYTPVNGPAPTQSNPVGATYVAQLPSSNFDDCTGSTVTGSISVSSGPGGSGASVSVNFEGLPDPTVYGPFVYHIHDLPVPADGNCTSTLGHLDPQNGGEYFPCIVSAPQNCQVGDLAGKHGAISTSSFTTEYVDPFISTASGNGASVAGRSIVIHTANTTRITCANFQLVAGNSTSPSGAVPSGTGAPMPSTSFVPSNEAAQITGYGALATFAMAVAFFL